MIQLCEGQGLFAKLLSGIVIAQHSRRQHLQRNLAVQLLVERAIHHAHSTSPELAKNQIMLKFLPNHSTACGRMLGGACIEVNAGWNMGFRTLNRGEKRWGTISRSVSANTKPNRLSTYDQSNCSGEPGRTRTYNPLLKREV